MSVETLERTALALGFESLEAFVRLKLTEHIEQSIAEYKALIANFTQKYQVDYADFLLHFHQIEVFSLFEKEDDSLNWEVTLHRLAHAEGLLRSLYSDSENNLITDNEIDTKNKSKQVKEFINHILSQNRERNNHTV